MTFAPQKDEAIGTINNIVSRSIVQRVYNDGDNTYLTVKQESRNSLPLTSPSSTLIVPLTNPNVDFVQFDKSFIRVDTKITLNLSGFEAADTDTPKDTATATQKLFVFVGLKNSSDFISEYAIYHKGKQVAGTLQSNATVESFLYHASRSEGEMKNRTGIHSVAEYVARGDETNACGVYLGLDEIQAAMATTTHTISVDLHLDIPFNDILIFQQFQTYPSALFGDLELRFKVNPNALVCMQCNPLDTIQEQAIRLADSSFKKLINQFEVYATDYTHDYTQLGDSFKAITHALLDSNSTASQWLTGYQKLILETDTVSFNFNAIELKDCYSTIIGYRAKPESLEKMRTKFEKYPWVKFSQNINYLQFSQKPSASGCKNMTQQIYLNNTTDILLLFPTTQHEASGTVFKNPQLVDLYLTAMNRKFPENGLDTTSPEFVHLMLNNSRGTPKKEFVDSLSTKRWLTTGVCEPEYDRTSFICSLKVERPSAMGLICDGLDSKGYQVPVRLMASPEFAGCQYDSYCHESETNHTVPPPILITVNDSYFIFNSKDGGQCIYSNRPFNETVSTFMSQ